MANGTTILDNLKFTTAVYNLSAEKNFTAKRIAERINALKFMQPVKARDVKKVWDSYGNRTRFRRYFGKHQSKRCKANEYK